MEGIKLLESNTITLTHNYQGKKMVVPEGRDSNEFFLEEHPKWVATVEKALSNAQKAQVVTSTVAKVFSAPPSNAPFTDQYGKTVGQPCKSCKEGTYRLSKKGTVCCDKACWIKK
jgi:hypothetical protein